MSRIVICIKELELNKHDEFGYDTESSVIIPKGTRFNWDESNTHRIIGGDIYLENSDIYIEISKETFETHFSVIDNSINNVLDQLTNHELYNKTLKFWDINLNAWVDSDNLLNYKVEKEVATDNEIIFYVYLEECNEDE